MKPAPWKINLTTKHSNEQAVLRWARYGNGRTALEFHSLTGEPLLRATVNMPEFTLAPQFTLIKTWAENEGLLKCLTDNEIIEPIGVYYTIQHDAQVAVCRWLVTPYSAGGDKT